MTCSANYILTTFGNCVTCGANSCFSGDVCIDCDPGYYSAGGTCSSCSQCPTGCSACTSATQCSACTDTHAHWNGSACVAGSGCMTTASTPGASCFWMQNYGAMAWVPSYTDYNGCRALDGCDGGGNQSGGGCYKWSVGSNGCRSSW